MILILLLEAMGIAGMCVLVILIGWFSTARVRLEHSREMLKLSEQSKLNSLTIRERDMDLTQRQLNMINGAPVLDNSTLHLIDPDRFRQMTGVSLPERVDNPAMSGDYESGYR